MALQVNSVYYTGPRVRPERAGSVDQLDFQQRRQMIASSLSFSDLISGHKVCVNGKEIQQGAGVDVEQGAKQNGDMVRGVPGPRSRTPPVERKHKFASLGRLFKPWKWKRKKKSDKFAETQRSLERKISVRANREDLIQKGILLPDTPTSALPSANVGDAPDLLKERDHLNGAVKSSPHPSSHHHPAAPAYSASSASSQQQEAAQQPSSAAASQQASGGAVGPTPPPRPDRPASMALPLRGDPGSASVSSAEQRFSLSRLPDPPIAVTDIGPIPPPPMFSNGSSAPGAGGVGVAAAASGGPPDGGSSVSVTTAAPLDLSDARFEDLEEEEVVCGDYDDDDEEYYPMAGIAGGRGDEPGPPPREPRLDLKPLKSALKKPRAAAPEPGSQSPMRPLAVRQDNQAANFRFGANKENAAATTSTSGEDSDDSDGPIPYRDEPADGDSGVLTRLGSRVQRTDSLALKLALRPDRQELIDRNIIHVTSEQDRTDWRSELAAKLNRRLSLRPTAEELEDRNILKKMSQEESMRDMEAKKATLLRKLSFRPTVEELKQRKVIHFNDYVDVTQAHEYDRRADKPWTRLTPRDKAMIRKELNDFKSSEMDVHEESRHLTRFHRP